MKLLIVFCAVLALVCADWAPRTTEQIAQDRDACFTESKLSEHCIHMIRMGQFPQDPGCYYRCMALKAGIFDDVNGYNNDRAYDAMIAGGFELEKANFVKCNSADKKNEDTCKWSADVAKCMLDNKYVTRKS